jgi:hypothetical protein
MKIKALNQTLNTQELDVVISVFNESTIDLQNVLPSGRLFIYHKGQSWHDPSHAYFTQRLTNVGREAHTYLHHICENYDSLRETTLFVLGTLLTSDEKYGLSKLKTYHATLENIGKVKCLGFASGKDNRDKYDPCFVINNYQSSTDDRDIRLPSSYRPFSSWYEHFIGDTENIKKNGVTYNGIFAVSREAIRRHPLHMYKNLRDELAKHNTSEAVHFMERSWCSIFMF